MELIRKLVETHRQTLPAIVAPLVDDRRGNPVLFDRETFADLRQVKGDQGGRAIFAKYAVEWLPWMDPAVSLDIDTPQDYQQLQGAAS